MESPGYDLKESKLAYFIRLIPKNELQKFNEFLDSPYFGVSTGEKELFARLKKAIDHDRPCVAGEVSALLFPDQEDDAKRIARLRKLNTRLLQRILQFFELQYAGKMQPNLPNQLASLLQYGASEQFEHYYDRAQQRLLESPLNSFNALQLFMLEIERSANQSSTSRSEVLPLQRALNHLEQFYVLQRLRLLAAMKNQTSVLGLNSALISENDLLQAAELAHSSSLPLMQIYIHILNLKSKQSDQQSEKHFLALKALLRDFGSQIEPTEAEELYSHAVNYCILQINQGNEKYLEEYFLLYQQIEQFGIIARQGQASIAHFKNVITGAVKMGRSAWAKELVQNHQIDDPLLNGILKFHLQDFEAALSDLFGADVQGKDVFYRLSHRVYIVMALYETSDVDAFESYAKALQMFLRRNLDVPEIHRKSQLNFVRFIFKIYHSLHGKPNAKAAKLSALEKELDRSDSVAQKAWLMEKIGSLSKNAGREYASQPAKT